MKIKAENLLQSMLSNKYSTFWISGDEPLLVQESADLVRKHHRDLGFEDREIFNVDSGFDLERFKNSVNNLTLFSAKKIFELRLGKVTGKNGSSDKLKLGQNEKTAIDSFINSNNPDFTLIITSLKLDKTSLNSKWLKAHEHLMALVQVWPIDRNGLIKWLSRKLNALNIDADREALLVLSERVEGNLLAANQEVEKLKLLANLGNESRINLDTKTVMQVVGDNSRFDAYDLVDAALLGDSPRCQRIIANLKDEVGNPLFVLNALTRELRSLNNMIDRKESGQRVNSILQTSRIFFHRKQAVTNALQRLSSREVWSMLDKARNIDKAIKGAALQNPWDEISVLVLELGGYRVSH